MKSFKYVYVYYMYKNQSYCFKNFCKQLFYLQSPTYNSIVLLWWRMFCRNTKTFVLNAKKLKYILRYILDFNETRRVIYDSNHRLQNINEWLYSIMIPNYIIYYIQLVIYVWGSLYNIFKFIIFYTRLIVETKPNYTADIRQV